MIAATQTERRKLSEAKFLTERAAKNFRAAMKLLDAVTRDVDAAGKRMEDVLMYRPVRNNRAITGVENNLRARLEESGVDVADALEVFGDLDVALSDAADEIDEAAGVMHDAPPAMREIVRKIGDHASPRKKRRV